MRLIDADALLTDRKKRIYYHLPNGDTAIPIIDIEHAPTIDAVPVVRCKDCALLSGGKCKWWNMIPLSDNWFCADGERKEDSQ